MAKEIPIATKVSSDGGNMLRVRFAGDRRDYRIDLAGLFARSPNFAPLVDDAKVFAKVGIMEDGIGISWPIKTKSGCLDISASTLRRIADEAVR
jgi:hypothetical protein